MRRAFATAALAATCLLACQVLVGVRDEDGVPRPRHDNDDEGGAAADAGHDPCVKRTPPPPPSREGAPTDELNPRFFAVQRFKFIPPSVPTIGYDLDDRCTGSPTSTTSEAPCVSPAGGHDASDDDDGVDNAFAKMLATVRGVLPSESGDFAAETFGKNIDDGKVTLLVQLTQYNGEPNDPEVYVALVPSTGLSKASLTCDRPEDAGPGPQWDGCDEWDVPPGTLFDDSDAAVALRVSPGYVVDDQLVMRSDEPITFTYGASSFELYHPIVTAKIVRTDGGLSLEDGVVAGRAPARGLIDLVAQANPGGGPLCETETYYNFVVTKICSARDLRLSRSDDGKGLACDAVSFAFGFTALPARLGKENKNPASSCDAAPECAP